MRHDEALGDQELEFTKAKDDAIGREISLFRAQLLQVDDMMKKGLSVTTQHLSLEQNVVQLESNRLDLKLMILKSQQNHRKFERAVQDLRTQTSNETLAEATKTQASLTDLLNQRRAASASTATAGEGSKECGQAAVSIYLIAKGPDGVLQAFPVAAPPAPSRSPRSSGRPTSLLTSDLSERDARGVTLLFVCRPDRAERVSSKAALRNACRTLSSLGESYALGNSRPSRYRPIWPYEMDRRGCRIFRTARNSRR